MTKLICLFPICFVSLSSIYVLSGCSAFAGRKQQIELADDAYVTSGKGKTLQKKKGEKFIIPAGESVFVEAPGHIGLLVLTDSEYESTKKVELKRADDWMGPAVQKQLSASLTEIVSSMNEAQILLSSRKSIEALSRVLRLEKKYPDLVPLELLEASCHVVLGDRSKAVMVLTDVLRAEPDNEQARTLYKSLGGDDGAPRRSEKESKKPIKKGGKDD